MKNKVEEAANQLRSWKEAISVEKAYEIVLRDSIMEVEELMEGGYSKDKAIKEVLNPMYQDLYKKITKAVR
ncbi:MAG: hypothetical protein HKO92_06505 [Flavobacteriaceae bacterium]|nr:hypothetical protein [Flavobacteriaceae bacterium]